MGPTQERYTIVRYHSGTFSKQTDEIVTESPITIKLNGEEYVTVVCTPNYIEEIKTAVRRKVSDYFGY
ncbi:hypothetical protein ACT453_41000, partial [Bacillus sp. D-CC]